MSEMRIYVVNLAKYNEGKLVGGWFNLPLDMEEVYEKIFEPHELDKDGRPYGDFAIHDYELPFEISEYENIENLNEMVSYLQGLDTAEPILKGNYDMGDVINFANEIEKEEHVEHIIDDESLDEFVEYQAKVNGWQRVAHMLHKIDYMNEKYYYINGYGNIENVPVGHEEMLVKDMLSEIKEDFLDKRKTKIMDKNNNFEMER